MHKMTDWVWNSRVVSTATLVAVVGVHLATAIYSDTQVYLPPQQAHAIASLAKTCWRSWTEEKN
jgi:hypothetical protein